MLIRDVKCPACGGRTKGRSSQRDGEFTVCYRMCLRKPVEHRLKATCLDVRGERRVQSVRLCGKPIPFAGPNCRFDGCDRLRQPKGNSGRLSRFCYAHEKQRQRHGLDGMKPIRWTGQTRGTPKKRRRFPVDRSDSRKSKVPCWRCESLTMAQTTTCNGMRSVVYRICGDGHRGYYRRDGSFLGTNYYRDGRVVVWLALKDGS